MKKEELIVLIKESGQTIINNAESIAGTERTLQNINITIDISLHDRVPTITINKDLCPEGWLERMKQING